MSLERVCCRINQLFQDYFPPVFSFILCSWAKELFLMRTSKSSLAGQSLECNRGIDRQSVRRAERNEPGPSDQFLKYQNTFLCPVWKELIKNYPVFFQYLNDRSNDRTRVSSGSIKFRLRLESCTQFAGV